MLVKKWMKTPAITVQINTSLEEAMKLIDQHGIHMLPVLEKKKLVGIVTDRDLRRSEAAAASTMEIYELKTIFAEMKVSSIMTADLVTIPLDYTIEEAAELLLENKISGLPVVDGNGDLAGVITKTDIFRVIISLTGLRKRGIQFAMIVEDRAGSIREVTEVIRSAGGRVASILTSYDDVPSGFRNVYIRMYDIDRSKLDQVKKGLREKSKLMYMVDRRENVREIYQ